MDDLKLAGLPEIGPDDVVSKEVVEYPQVTNERSLARRVALQVLYEVDSADHPVEQVIAAQIQYHPEYVTESLDEIASSLEPLIRAQLESTQLSHKSAEYMRQVVLGVIENHQKIDRVIKHFAPEFPLSQVALIDRNVLRIAIYEIAFDQRVPLRVAIDEAVELGKLYGSEGTPRFVNGVLGAVASDTDTVGQVILDIQKEEELTEDE